MHKHTSTYTTEHTGHFTDNLPSQSLDWCKNEVFQTKCLVGISKANLAATKLNKKL